MLADSHAHLEMTVFDSDREEVLKRALQDGISLIVTVGTSENDWPRTLAIASREEMVWASLGIHPHHAREITPATYDQVRQLITHDKVVAYGEIGLDFHYHHSPRGIQMARFGEQLELAQELDLPIIIHCREAHREVLEMLYPRRGQLYGVFHCFSGDREVARQCLDLGYHLSIPGTVTFPKADELREVVKYAPLDRLLLETDAPYLTPEPYRGKRNEPSYLAHTARALASLLDLTPEEVSRATFANTCRLFQIKRT
jgi:TatD DNase family protein